MLFLPLTCAQAQSRHVHTVWVINMENKNWTGDTIANNLKGNPAAPYINNTLIKRGAHAEDYINLIHPSEPNKIWEEAGSNLGVVNDGPVAENHQSTTTHLVTLLTRAGKTWKAYDEYTNGTTCPVASWHTGIIFFDDVTGNRNPNYVPCIKHFRPMKELQIDLNANSVANYNYINPGLCHEMHPTT